MLVNHRRWLLEFGLLIAIDLSFEEINRVVEIWLWNSLSLALNAAHELLILMQDLLFKQKLLDIGWIGILNIIWMLWRRCFLPGVALCLRLLQCEFRIGHSVDTWGSGFGVRALSVRLTTRWLCSLRILWQADGILHVIVIWLLQWSLKLIRWPRLCSHKTWGGLHRHLELSLQLFGSQTRGNVLLLELSHILGLHGQLLILSLHLLLLILPLRVELLDVEHINLVLELDLVLGLHS